MPSGNFPVAKFNRGKISRLALARTDIERLESAAEEQTNWVPRVLGSMMLRPGWKFLSSTLGDNYAYNIRFVKSTDDTALLEQTNESMRVWVDDEVVTRNAVSTTIRGGDFSADITNFLKVDDPATIPTANANDVAFSPDGQLMAVAHDNSTINLTIYYNSGTTETPVWTKLADPTGLAGTNATGVAFSPDGSLLVYVFSGGTFARAFSVAGTGASAVFTAVTAPATIEGICGGVAFSPSGEFLAIAHATTPFISLWSVSGTTFTELADPADLPASTGNGCAFSSDSRFLAVAHTTTPFVTIYEINGDTFTKLDDPADLPAGNGQDVAWSRDGNWMAVAHTTTPFVTIYAVDGSTFTKASNPGTLPDADSRGCAFSSDSQFLAVVHGTSPYLSHYRNVAGVWTKQTDPATAPDGTGNRVAFSPNNHTMAIAHDTTAFLTLYQAYQWLDMDGSGAASTYGGISGEFVTASAWTVGAAVGLGFNGYTIRQVVHANQLTRSGSKVKISFKGTTTDGNSISSCYIGKRASVGDVYDFASAPTQVTFNGGSAGFSITSTTPITSDEITFNIDEAANYVIAYRVTSAFGNWAGDTNAGANQLWAKAASNETSVINATGYTDFSGSAEVMGISLIEVFETTGTPTTGLSLVGTGYAEARRTQAVSVLNADKDTEHAIRVVIGQGEVSFHVGTEFGGDDLVTTRLLEPGTHSFAFTPGTNLFFVEVHAITKYTSIPSSVTIEGAGDLALPTPYAEANLPDLRYAQSGDIVYLACDDVAQQKILRYGVRSWGIVSYRSKDGPFRTLNTALITMTASALNGDITLTASREYFKEAMVGTLFRISSVGQATSDSFTAQNQFSTHIKVTGAGTVRNVSIVRSGTWSATITLQRSVSEPGTWVDVATFTTNGTATYNDALDNQIIYYRIGIKTGDYTSGTAVVSLSYSSGTQDGIARVTAYTSPTEVDAIVLSPMGGTTAFETWSEGLWSDHRGYPSAVALYEGRLWWAGMDKVIGSVSDAYESFDDTTEGDSGPISRSIGEGPVDNINWLLPIQRLLVGTEGSELSAKSNSFDEPLTPDNFTLKACSTHGSDSVNPVRIDDTGVFTHRTGTRVMQLAYDVDTYDYASADLTQLVPEQCAAGIRRMAVQRLPDTRVHVVLDDGTAALLVFDKSEDVICWIDIETDGLIEDVAVLPGTPEDSVYYVVKRTINSVEKRYLEKWALETECVGGTLNKQADSFILYDGVSSVSMTGLDHLEGEEVVVWGDGRYNGAYIVSGGAITLDTAVEEAVIGLTYRARFKSVKLAYAAAGGTALTKRKRITGIGLICADLHHQGLRYGDSFTNMRELPGVFKGKTVAADTIHTEYDDDVVPMNSDWSTDSRLCLEANAPKPGTVLAAVISIETNG